MYSARRGRLAGSGLGRKLYKLAEELARMEGRAGMALETAREADWLFAWYKRLGFAPVGALLYPGSAVETILMLKTFSARGRSPRPGLRSRRSGTA